MHWRRPDRGARLLADNAPAGQVHWAGRRGPAHQRRLPWSDNSKAAAFGCSTSTWKPATFVSYPWSWRALDRVGVCGHGGMVFVVYSDCADVFEPSAGGDWNS